MKMIGQGNTAEIYKYGEDKIIKLFRKEIPKEVAALEYEKAVFVQTYVENVPKAYDFITENNRYGIIYDRIYGIDLIKIIIKSIGKINHYSRTLALLHMSIHQKKVKVNEEFSVKNKLRCDIEAVEALSYEQKEFLTQYLKELPDGEVLCHFDFHPGNIMIQGKEPIIIDWMTACVGNPCADIARTYLILNYGELPNGTYLVRKLVRLFQRHVGKIYYREYLKHSVFTESDIEKWILPVAAARLREWIPDSEKKILSNLVNEKMRTIRN